MSVRPLLRLAVATSLATGPTLAAQEPALRVEYENRAPVMLSVQALRRLPSDTLIHLVQKDSSLVRFRAVRLLDVMIAGGAPLDSLRIGRTGWVIALLASDGYVALFSAAELEPKIGPTRAFIAYARDGAALTEREAPFHVIVPTDGHGTRNARMVTTLRIWDALPARPH